MSALFHDRSAGLAMQFALLLVPIMLCSGGGLEYANAMRIRSALQEAADAASVSLISANARTYATATTASSDGVISGSATEGAAIFNANVAQLKGLTTQGVTVTASAIRSARVLTSTLTFSANVPAMFTALAGQGNWTLVGSATATAQLPKYMDFYLMIDVSGSMGLPTSNSEQTRLAAVNPDNRSQYPGGCVFACHFSGNSGYSLSRNGGNWSNPQVSSCATAGTSACIQLRTDAVGVAIKQLLQTAQNSEVVTDQYRIGLYPFIAKLKTYFAITKDIDKLSTDHSSLAYAAETITNLLDTGVDTTLQSGGTHFDVAMTQMNATVTSVGTGLSIASPMPVVFLVTDGAQNNQYYSNGNWSGSNSPTTLDPAYCTTLKNRGITIAVLYIPYLPIQNPTDFANSEDFYANDNIPYIPGQLRRCASTNFFFTANTPADITSTMNTMFHQAVASARITD